MHKMTHCSRQRSPAAHPLSGSFRDPCLVPSTAPICRRSPSSHTLLDQSCCPSSGYNSQATPLAQGLRDMDEYRVAFPTHSGASIFCAHVPTELQYRQLYSMPSDKVHVGCQVGKVYRIIVREHAEAIAMLGVLLEYTPQPKKKSKQGGEETFEESTARHSSPRAWVTAVIPVPDAFAPLPTPGELGMNIDIKWGLPACMRRLSPQTTFFFARVEALCVQVMHKSP